MNDNTVDIKGAYELKNLKKGIYYVYCLHQFKRDGSRLWVQRVDINGSKILDLNEANSVSKDAEAEDYFRTVFATK